VTSSNTKPAGAFLLRRVCFNWIVNEGAILLSQNAALFFAGLAATYS
jgi:hypothetical protein